MQDLSRTFNRVNIYGTQQSARKKTHRIAQILTMAVKRCLWKHLNFWENHRLLLSGFDTVMMWFCRRIHIKVFCQSFIGHDTRRKVQGSHDQLNSNSCSKRFSTNICKSKLYYVAILITFDFRLALQVFQCCKENLSDPFPKKGNVSKQGLCE